VGCGGRARNVTRGPRVRARRTQARARERPGRRLAGPDFRGAGSGVARLPWPTPLKSFSPRWFPTFTLAHHASGEHHPRSFSTRFVPDMRYGAKDRSERTQTGPEASEYDRLPIWKSNVPSSSRATRQVGIGGRMPFPDGGRPTYIDTERAIRRLGPGLQPPPSARSRGQAERFRVTPVPGLPLTFTFRLNALWLAVKETV
jgi:hypothetical protein